MRDSATDEGGGGERGGGERGGATDERGGDGATAMSGAAHSESAAGRGGATDERGGNRDGVARQRCEGAARVWWRDVVSWLALR